MAAITIIAILTAIALPSFVGYTERAKEQVCITNSLKLKRLYDAYLLLEYINQSLNHTKTVIGANVEIDTGTVIMARVVINNSTRIGKGCIINTSSSLDHDNFNEDYVHISPGVRTAGSVSIGKGIWLGIGSVVSNNVNIYSGCIIGAGTVVVKDITKPGKYVWGPVRMID